MFKTGDLILYGSTGVCRVEDIRPMKSSGKDSERLFYILHPLYQDCVISAPVDSVKVYMRPIMTRAEAEALIDSIPSRKPEVFHTRAVRQLQEHYESSLKSHDCDVLMDMTMSIYEKKKCMEREKKKFGAVDERFMRRAEELLFGELAAALGIGKEEVPEYIEKRLGDERSFANDGYHP